MPKSPEQLVPEENKEEDRNRRFENLVGVLVQQSTLFPEKQLTPDTKLNILEAIRNNETALYLGGSPSERRLDATYLLLAIYDELGKEEPDEDFLSETVEQLKEYA